MRPFVQSLTASLILTALLVSCGGGTEPSGPAPASLVVSVSLPDSVNERTLIAPAPTLHLIDADGAEVSAKGVPITVQSLTGGVQLDGVTTRNTDGSGTARFDSLRVRGTAGQVSIRFSSPGLPPVTLGPVTLRPGRPASASLGIVPATVPAGELVPPFTLLVRDSSGNNVEGASLSLSVLEGGGSSFTTSTTGADGNAIINGWRVGGTVGTNRLSLSIPAVTGLEREAVLTAVPGLVTRLTFAAAWPALVRAGTTIPSPFSAAVSDTFGNPVPAQAVVFEITEAPSGGPTPITVGSVLTDAQGHGTLASLVAATTAGSYRFRARVNRSGTSVTHDTLLTVSPDSAVDIGKDWPGGKWPSGLPRSGRVAVRDRFGNRHAGATLDLNIAAGGGSVARLDSISGSDGWTRFAWTPGAAGAQLLAVSSMGLPPTTLAMTAVAPADLLLESGDGQTVVAGNDLPALLVVQVVDSAGMGIADAPLDLYRNSTFVKSWLTDTAGRVSFGFVGAGSKAGDQAFSVRTVWLPTDTVTVVAHVVAGPPAFLHMVGSIPSFVVGHPVDGPLVLELTDRTGNPLPGFPFALSVDSGSLAGDSSTTDSLGRMVVPAWALGTVAGSQHLTATSGAFTVHLAFDVRPGPVVTFTLQSGAEGFAGEAVGVAPRLKGEDSYGNPAAAEAVELNVLAGGGSVDTIATFDARGFLDVSGWVAGAAPGLNKLRARAGGQTIDVSFTSSPASPFNIVLRGASGEFEPVFRAAAYRWRRRITADIPDLNSVFIAGGQCASFQEAVNGTVDDLIIDVNVGPIDGVGGILGGATPCFIRTVGKLPLLGVMHFDEADISQLRTDGTLGDVILHEMGHVLGIGSLWSTLALVINPGTVSPQYIGPGGEQGWLEIGGGATGSVQVPVENLGGAGTRDVHWRESVMPSELMTGYLSALVNPMSAVTVRSLADLGYTVDPTTADPYTVFTAPMPAPGRAPLHIRDLVGGPKFEVDQAGRITPIP